MLYLGSDHGGYALKEELKKFLDKQGVAFSDVGPNRIDPQDDYPEFGSKVAAEVSKDAQNNKGILMCRSGHGVSIVANKFKNVRAALCWNEQVARASRRDDDANVLCLPSDYISPEIAEEITKVFLNTPFSPEERFVRRIREIKALE